MIASVELIRANRKTVLMNSFLGVTASELRALTYFHAGDTMELRLEGGLLHAGDSVLKTRVCKQGIPAESLREHTS